MNKNKCEICKKTYLENEMISGHGIRHEIEKLIVEDYPTWNDNSQICKDDFNVYRMKYIEKLIEEEKGSINTLESAVIKSINENEVLTTNINITDEPLKVGEKISDKVAYFGGSWKFIIAFFAFIFLWIILNSVMVIMKPFDSFPFILLNLILSCIASIQAPIIMMSQNRQEKKDRIRSENDYKINLKSEIEIRTLHEKVDHLLLVQWSKMMKIQEVQLEVLEEIRNRNENNSK